MKVTLEEIIIKKKTFLEIFPKFESNCLCGHEIERQFYIMNKYTQKVKVIGSKCIEKFLPKNNRRKTCIVCGKAHQNRKDDKCKNCRPKKLPGNKCNIQGCNNRHKNRKYNICSDCGKVECNECGDEIYIFDIPNISMINEDIYGDCKYYSCDGEYILTDKQQSIIYNDRIYYKIPFEEKDDAKEFGAMWDKNKRLWYITSKVDKSRFLRWNKIDLLPKKKLIKKSINKSKSEELIEHLSHLNDLYESHKSPEKKEALKLQIQDFLKELKDLDYDRFNFYIKEHKLQQIESIMLFGKYKGETIKDVYNKDIKYLEWIIKETNLQKDIHIRTKLDINNFIKNIKK